MGEVGAAVVDSAVDSAVVAATDDVPAAAPLLQEADADLERRLTEEEALERRARSAHETPHFRSGDE